MEPIEIDDYAAQALALLTSQYTATAAPNLRAMLGALQQEKQALEAAFWQVYTLRQLGNATLNTLPTTNAVLDALGALVGQPRDGLDDADYQTAIRLRIAVNRATGRTTDWSTFAAILLRVSGGPVEYLDGGNAQFFFFVGDMPSTLNPNIVAQILSDADPNGVGPNVLGYSTWADGNDFEWCDVNDVATTGQGTWGDSVAGVVGGLLVSSVEL